MYTLDVIQKTIERVLGKNISKSRLKTELEKAVWIPETGRMVAIADSLDDLPISTRYGTFIKLANGLYYVTAGRAKYARALTTAEIAQCF